MEIGEPLKRRVYRWGTHVGILEDGKWHHETRMPCATNASYLSELCTPTPMNVMPMEMDDIWEEEYVPISKSLEYTGLVVLKGDARTVLETAATHGLPTPDLPATAITTQANHTSQNNHNSNISHAKSHAFVPKPKARCLIRD